MGGGVQPDTEGVGQRAGQIAPAGPRSVLDQTLLKRCGKRRQTAFHFRGSNLTDFLASSSAPQPSRNSQPPHRPPAPSSGRAEQRIRAETYAGMDGPNRRSVDVSLVVRWFGERLKRRNCAKDWYVMFRCQCTRRQRFCYGSAGSDRSNSQTTENPTQFVASTLQSEPKVGGLDRARGTAQKSVVNSANHSEFVGIQFALSSLRTNIQVYFRHEHRLG